jgi:hypothetical protein
LDGRARQTKAENLATQSDLVRMALSGMEIYTIETVILGILLLRFGTGCGY